MLGKRNRRKKFWGWIGTNVLFFLFLQKTDNYRAQKIFYQKNSIILQKRTWFLPLKFKIVLTSTWENVKLLIIPAFEPTTCKLPKPAAKRDMYKTVHQRFWTILRVLSKIWKTKQPPTTELKTLLSINLVDGKKNFLDHSANNTNRHEFQPLLSFSTKTILFFHSESQRSGLMKKAEVCKFHPLYERIHFGCTAIAASLQSCGQVVFAEGTSPEVKQKTNET